MSLRLLICVVMGIGAAGCRRAPAPAPSMEDVRSEVAPTQESWHVQYFVSETGADAEPSLPRLEIRAFYMATFETEDSTYTLMHRDSVDRVKAYFFDEAGDTSATLLADRILLDEDDDRFEARGNVVVDTPDDKTLESEHLVWFERTRELRTPGFVRIVTPTERVQGYNLVADEDLDTYTLKRMTGQVTVEDEE